MQKYGIELNVVDEITIVHRRCNQGHCHPAITTYDVIAAATALIFKCENEMGQTTVLNEAWRNGGFICV